MHSPALCRFGEKIVDGQVLSEEYIRCTPPPFDPVGQVQKITTSGSGYIADVQEIIVSASPDQPLIQVIETTASMPIIETQTLTIMGANIPEIQSIDTSVDTITTEVRTISTRMDPTITEVKTISLQATAINEVQQVNIGVNTVALLSSQLEVQTLAKPIALTETGTFAVEFQGAKTPPLNYGISISAFQAALESLPTIGTLRLTSSVSGNNNVWSITFLQNTGSLQLLLLDTSSLVVVNPSLVVVQSIQRSTTSILDGVFAMIFNGQRTRDVPVGASSDDVADAIRALPNIQNPIVVSRSELDCNGGASWIVTFVSTSTANGNLPTMSLYTGGLLGTSILANVVPISDSNSISGTFQLSYLGSLSGNLVPTTTETTMASVVQTLTQIPVTAVSRIGPTSVGGYTWSITFGGAPAIIPDITSIRALTGVGATVVVTTARAAQFPEIQQLVLSASSYIGGSFALQIGESYTRQLPSDISPTSLQSALNDLTIYGAFEVTKGIADAFGGCTWQITFSTLAGNQNMIKAWITNPLGLTSLFDSGSNDLSLTVEELQSGRGAGISGHFQLVVDGSTSGLISFAATSQEFENALAGIDPVQVSRSGQFGLNNANDWTITFLVPKAEPRQIAAVTTLLYPKSSFINIGTTKAGTIQEIRKVTTTLSSGSFVCQFMGKSSMGIPFNANATAFTTSLSVIPDLGRIFVSGVNPWVIVFTELVSPIPSLSCGGTQTVTVQQTSSSIQLGGAFKLGVNSAWTQELAPNVPAATIQSSLNTLLGANAVTVSTASVLINNGFKWEVTFTNMPGPQPLISVDYTTLSGTNAAVKVNRKIPGGQVSGTLRLSVNGLITSELTPLSTSVEIRNALVSTLNCVDCVLVTRINTGGASGFSWTIQFMPYDTTSQSYIKQLHPIYNSLSVVNSTLASQNLNVQIHSIANATMPIQGSFILTYRDQPSVSVSWDATPETLLLAIEHIKSIPSGLFSVSKTGPSISGGSQWTVTFPFNVAYPTELFKTKSSLVGANVNLNVRLLTPQTIPVQGSFKLQYQSQLSRSIPYNANSSDLVSALQAIPVIGGVSVSSNHDSLKNQWKWRVTFTSLANAGSLALLSSTFNVDGTSSRITISKIISGSHNQIQRISISSPSLTPTGTFKVSYLGVVSPITLSASCTALEMLAALNAIAALGKTLVERTAAINGQNGYTWHILFIESTQDKAQMVLNTAFLLPSTGLVTSVSTLSSSTIPLGGTFILTYGGICIDGDDIRTSSCTPASTAALSHSADALTMERELSLLPGLQNLQVTQSSADYLNGYTWLVSFPQKLGNIALLKSTNSLTGTNATVSVSIATMGLTFDDAKVAVGVSQNGQDFTLLSTVVYRYMPTILLYSLTPSHGPVTGGTEVIIRGEYFLNSSQLYCRFGRNIATAATIFNSTVLTCIAPAVPYSQRVVVDISTNGKGNQSTFSNTTSIHFTYDKPVSMNSITPLLGPTTGNSSVLIYGGPFPKTDELRCRFGKTVVNGLWVQRDAIRCVTPPQTPGSVALEISINNQDYTTFRLPYYFYPNPTLNRLYPVFGPANSAGTYVRVYGRNFVNTSDSVCRFGKVVVPSVYINPSQIDCITPTLSNYSGWLQPMPMSEQRNTYPDPSTGNRLLFPDARHFPLVLGRLVSVEISNNNQDYTFTGINFMYYMDPVVHGITPKRIYSAGTIGLLVQGLHYLNTTKLTCRIGVSTTPGVYLTPRLLLCPIETSHVKTSMPQILVQSNEMVPTFTEPQLLFVEVANNGIDFTSNRVLLEYLGLCPTGYYCPLVYQGRRLPCPRGSYCPGEGNANYTLCPRGTYQPLSTQSECVRCPIGYHCPHVGLHVPRICPAGYVCDVTGVEIADQPCPQGHFCLEGTATTSTACGQQKASRKLSVSFSHAERGSTIRNGRNGIPSLPTVGARQTGCWDNSTLDFGLQFSKFPTRFWQELQSMPISSSILDFKPIRGRYCMDDGCMKTASPLLPIEGILPDYQNNFALRRPVPCPRGMYCHAGTAGNVSVMKNYSSPQPCFESMYCPEGSDGPQGQGDCPAGFYCPFGIKIPCPAGTYCPLPGSYEPLHCPPGTFNGMIGQTVCTSCPEGYICPGFNRIQPVLCPSGYVCSTPQLATPNLRCPPGYYCFEGRITSDPFRNDTTLRPYPCKPGTYCLGGVISDDVVTGNFDYAQNCTAGFYCELASFSPKGIGMCPPGFYCPEGTAIPIPTPKGTFAARNGTVQAALCPPSYYAPTIETIECYPCPPGTTCPDDGTAVATICPPGSYRSTTDVDGITCVPCPQGTWSKNWGLRGVDECLLCPSGTVCATDGMTNPCSSSDFPLPYIPTNRNESMSECNDLGNQFFFGILLEPWIDSHGVGPHFLPHISGQCYYNPQPIGSPLYQRFTEYFGPLYDIATGAPHQGYGDVSQMPQPGYFDRGSQYVDLSYSTLVDLSQNCTRGFFFKEKWFPGTCEADVICYTEKTAQALICPEGYVCGEQTTDEMTSQNPCAPGYVCGYGTTPDIYLEAPMGQYKMLCPRSYFCPEATGIGLMKRHACPANHFCPTGTVDPYMGFIANDAERRLIPTNDANPFLEVVHLAYLREGDVRELSLHDKRCLDGIDPELQNTFLYNVDGNVVNAAIESDLLCARDNKWRHVFNTIQRGECDCHRQVLITLDIFQLWQCTTPCSYTSLNLDIATATSNGIQFQGYSTIVYPTYEALSMDVMGAMKKYLAPHPMQKGVDYTTQAPDELYDMYIAIQHISSLKSELPNWVNFLPGTNEILRLDMCECQRMFKCPNGTVSLVGSNSIENCVKEGYILRRRDLIPLDHTRQMNRPEFTALSGDDKPISHIMLNPLEVAIVTINATEMERNMTYGDHYQISVYKNCKPCPPLYKCSPYLEPMGCTYPNNNNQTGQLLYQKCLETQNASICDINPFYCEKRGRVESDGTVFQVPGCCSCERMTMPEFFGTNRPVLGYPDDKHVMIQFTITAVAQTKVTIVAELLHGLYYNGFESTFIQENIHLNIFTPSRARYTPEAPTSDSFLSVLVQDDFLSLDLPFNLPMSKRRIVKSTNFQSEMEKDIFIDRIADIMVGDPSYISSHNMTRLTNAQVRLGGVPNDTQQHVWDDYFDLKIIPDSIGDVQYSEIWWQKAQPDGLSSIALPYLPFFSACAGYDSHMSIAKVLETHPDCTFVDYNETHQVDELIWKEMTQPLADSCTIFDIDGIELECFYEENLAGGSDKSRWYEAESGTTLFHLTKYPIPIYNFIGNESELNPISWGQTDFLNSLIGTTDLISVNVGPDSNGYPLVIPQNIILTINYYQIEKGNKIFVNAQIDFINQCILSNLEQDIENAATNGILPCEKNIVTGEILTKKYILHVIFNAMPWLDLLNSFQFSFQVYFVFFCVIGIGSIGQGYFIYLINRLFTKMRHPPPFRFLQFIKATAPQPTMGLFYLSIPLGISNVFIYLWWNYFSSDRPAINPNFISFEHISGDWLYQSALDNQYISLYKKGRLGLSVVILGIFLLLLGLKLMIPDHMDQQKEDNIMNQHNLASIPTDPFEINETNLEIEENIYWNPLLWKRMNLLFITGITILTQVFVLEFSYSALFTDNCYRFLIVYKLIEHLYGSFFDSTIGDSFLTQSLGVVVVVSEGLITMAAPDFFGFVMGFIVMQSIMILERLFINPFLAYCTAMTPKWKKQLHRMFRKKRRRTRDQKAAEEAEWRKICQEIEEKANGIEAILDAFNNFAGDTSSLFINPLAMGFIYLFANETQIPALYSILETDLAYYIMFSVVTLPFACVLDIVLWNTQELIHGWKAFEYATYQRHRFSIRKERWQMNMKIMDKSIDEEFQVVDVLCFSSQYYFLTLLYASGMLFIIFGIGIWIRCSYNPLGDRMFFVIVAIIFGISIGITRLSIYFGNKLHIWVPRALRGTIDDEIAAKLALGAGRQEDLELERMEMQALNSERFRHRFLEKNRPWILQHMVELFTPRSLEMPGPLNDGKPAVEYVRDIYNELMNMGEGRRLKGDRSDISSDDEDELFKQRQNWSNIPVDGTTKDLALYWLAKARKRRLFNKFIGGILLQNKQDTCQVCQKAEASGYVMSVDIATPDGKEQDKQGLDRLIKGFEGQYGENEADPDLWKAYFRKNATYITLCNVCTSALEQKRIARLVQPVGKQTKTRPEDFSSDEETEEMVFEAMVVSRTSVEGRVMSKWLQAARKRMGGVFPRENARAEMEAYAERMRATKARKTKKKRIDSDDEDPSVHWKVNLTEASRALLIRWVWKAREDQYKAFREKGAKLRSHVEEIAGKMQEVDDWFFSKEMRIEGVQLKATAKTLAEDQLALEDEVEVKKRAIQQEVDVYVREKREAMTQETDLFNNMIETERATLKTKLQSREGELLEEKKKKEIEFLELQKQARTDNGGKVPPMLVQEHRAYLLKMDEDRRKEREDAEALAGEKENQKQEAFNRKLALSESGMINRQALTAHRLLALRKEMINTLKMQEKSWQNKATSWLEKATRKVAVKEQEDAENALAQKKRKKV